jgi:general nucleoside transport system ATP-binding protein
MAVAPGLTVAENFALVSPHTYQRSAGFGMDWARVARDMDLAYRALDLEPPAPSTRCGELSGGNLQRFVLARELGRNPKILVALYPTRGLDAMTTAHAQGLLASARSAGAAVLLISQDLGELFALSDRLAVMHDGRLIPAGAPHDTTMLEVGRLMTGAA